jgi:hypothetical protein
MYIIVHDECAYLHTYVVFLVRQTLKHKSVMYVRVSHTTTTLGPIL